MLAGRTVVSIRLARGIWYRTSAFRGHPIQIEQMTEVGLGTADELSTLLKRRGCAIP
jgi:hypothetical protein